MKKRINNMLYRVQINFDAVTQLLDKYRVWFETVMCVTLSICAIVVSIQANKIAQSQYSYERTQNSPYFVVDSYLDNNSGIAYVIDNTGGDVRQCYVYVNHYICGDFGSSSAPDDKEVYLIAKDINRQAENLFEEKYLPFEFSFPMLNNELVSDTLNDEMRLMGNSIMFYQFAIITINYTDNENTESTEHFFVYDGKVEDFTENQMSDLDYHFWGFFDVNESNFLENILRCM